MTRPARPNKGTAPNPLNTRRMDEVTPVPVNWLWPARLPLGMLTILDGDPALGKSTIAVDIAARLSTGLPFPGSSTPVAPAAIVFMCAEDSAEHTIRPRLEAAGADLTRCHVIETVSVGEMSRPIILPTDLSIIEKFCTENGVKLIVIDPLFGFVAAELDSHKDHSIRAVLHALKLTAERTGAAVLAVRHLNKGNGGAALYRGGGSIAITAQARVVLSVGRNPNRQEERVLAVTKSNLAKVPKALTYDLETVPVGLSEVSRVRWGDESDLTADDIVTHPSSEGGRPAEGRDRAEEFLKRELSGGPVPSADLIDRAKAERIKKGTLFNARAKLGVRSSKEGFSGRWVWSLAPPAEDLLPKDSPTLPPGESSRDRQDTAKIHSPELTKIHSPEDTESSSAVWDDPVQFSALMRSHGWSWPDVVRWVNQQYEANWAPGVKFFDMSKKDRVAAAEFLARSGGGRYP